MTLEELLNEGMYTEEEVRYQLEIPDPPIHWFSFMCVWAFLFMFCVFAYIGLYELVKWVL